MKENEKIEALLQENAFKQMENPDEWVKNEWTVRFFEDEMEIFEQLSIKGIGRYLLTDIDLSILEEILEEIN